ncbi:MAG: hypothetical protein M3P43_07855, partial [Actinomycetota bacterium]|nr:hypothetical protein [Actinomycetota bacterium]
MRKHRSFRLFAAAALAALVIVASLVGTSASAHKVPQWIKHVQHWNGGISNGVRERAAQAAGDLTVPQTLSRAAVKIGSATLDNVQMNGDSDPPLPQDEPSIAESLDDPMNAVAASNDYTGDGFWIGSTTDGGQT